MRWAAEADPWLHWYLNFDWADCYGRITRITPSADEVREGVPNLGTRDLPQLSVAFF